MIKLDAGNVILKPSHRRQLMGWLKRSIRLGERMGDFLLTLTIERVGRMYQIKALVHDAAGDFNCHSRQRVWRGAVREIIHMLETRLHSQNLQRA